MPAELGPIGQIARTVDSIEQSEKWYRDVLGLLHLYTFGHLAFFDCGGVRLASPGVEFISAPHLIHRHPDGTEVWMAFFKDLEGRTLALMSQARQAAP